MGNYLFMAVIIEVYKKILKQFMKPVLGIISCVYVYLQISLNSCPLPEQVHGIFLVRFFKMICPCFLPPAEEE